MPRPRNIIPSIQVCIMLPEDVKGRLDLLLFSEVEGRIPLGAYQNFLVARIQEFFGSESLDLAPFLVNSPPGSAVVRGSPGTVQQLKRILET